jgi:F-type H+-transporting ATPase subunit b
MDATLHALGDILLRAIPTFLLVILLHFYLKSFFFKPLERVLAKRYEASEGAKKVAEQSIERANAKTAEYEAAVRSAKGDMYHAQEQARKAIQQQIENDVLAARKAAESAVQEAKAELGREVEAAKAGLARESEILANQIAESILRRSAA